MFEILLKTNNKFGISIGSHNFFIEPEKPKQIVVDDTDDINFQFYFADHPSLIYPVCLKFDGTRWVTESKFVFVTKISEQKYLCQIEKNAQFFSKKAKKIAINNIFFNIFENGIVEIEAENDLLFCEDFDFCVSNANVVELCNNNYAVNLFSAKNTEKTIVINSSFASVLMFENTIFEKTENGFKVLQEVFDIANHGIVQTFEISNDIKLVDEYAVYIKNRPLNNFCPQVLPIYFLQCVKANDFSQAKRCLADSISQKVSNEGLKAYFGNFVDIIVFENQFFLKYSTTTSQNFVTKQCNFLIADGKISKIDLI